MTRVSVVVTSHNRLDFLKRAVGSVLDQEYPDIEVIVTDDHSTDGSWEWIRRMSAERGIVGIRQKNNFGAPTRPRNDGLFASTGGIVNFLDEDNLFCPGRVISMVGEIRGGVDLVYCLSQCFNDGRPVNPPWGFPPEAFDSSLLKRKNYIDTAEPAIRREAIGRVGFFDERLEWNEEWDLWRRFDAARCGIMCIPQMWNHYTIHRQESRSGRMEIRRASNARIVAKHRALLKRFRAEVSFGGSTMSFDTLGQFDGPEVKEHEVIVCRGGEETPARVSVAVK
jgi:glycosyltransferase involved in cell wall biosynthesis